MQNKEVKKLLKKIALLALPFFAWPLIEVLALPVNFFTFRIWETISVNTMRVLSGPFYPNMYMKMTEEGELAPHSHYATKRTVEWFTDAYGYRNRDTKCDVLLIGDSNITGVKLTQKETMAEVLERSLNKEVYSFAPATINRFLATDRFNQNPPQTVIVSSIERRIPTLPAVGENGVGPRIRNFTGNLINSSPVLTNLIVSVDRASKLILYRRVLADIDRAFGKKEYLAYQNELFMEGDLANRTLSEEEIEHIANILLGYKETLTARGIRFLFMPIPNKENIYYQLLPSKKKPDFLPRLMAKLRERGIEYIDTQEHFEQLYEKQKVALFPKDDAHWNHIAVKEAAGLITKRFEVPEQPHGKEDNFLVEYNP